MYDDYLTYSLPAALATAVLYGTFKLGVQWERDRPKREMEADLARADVWGALMERAQSELRDHRFRVAQPDDTSRAALQALVSAMETLTPETTKNGVSFPKLTNWEDASARIREATAALEKDRRRYIPRLTADEEARLREYGVEHPVLRDPSLAGTLRHDAV